MIPGKQRNQSCFLASFPACLLVLMKTFGHWCRSVHFLVNLTLRLWFLTVGLKVWMLLKQIFNLTCCEWWQRTRSWAEQPVPPPSTALLCPIAAGTGRRHEEGMPCSSLCALKMVIKASSSLQAVCPWHPRSNSSGTASSPSPARKGPCVFRTARCRFSPSGAFANRVVPYLCVRARWNKSSHESPVGASKPCSCHCPPAALICRRQPGPSLSASPVEFLPD